ncbi:Retrovirus-related Pol polyprotein from transposon TNT 1-94 [Dendrobium catenatum]|uniref:Retrovirus-related Pol polyprotein from transposon TNT 1-94 n=1 Tax=Dendrobium catenatum TaxID=906689 RepID=A0A2I0WQM8_9ASPA|nr:Retrovirus-related Pol polyprotein from transposon TNT 1-94 [Dendrobium catenatum]
MAQYLTSIKSLVDNISAAGATIDSEDIVLYTLNGLPPSYQAFKTAIRTKQGPLSLDELYSYLLTEEITFAADSSKAQLSPDVNTALFTSRGRGHRGRGRDWYIDSGASSHFTHSVDNLQQPTSYQGMDSITVGNGQNLPIANSGSDILPTPSSKLLISNIYHVPHLTHNMLSVSNLTNDNNVSISFSQSGFSIKDLKTKATLLQGPCRNGLYTIKLLASNHQQSALSVSRSNSNKWHNRLGHPNRSILTVISTQNKDLHILISSPVCAVCKASKSHKLAFKHSSVSTSVPLVVLYLDVWGPSPVSSNQGYKYYLLIVDEYFRFTWLFLLCAKSETTNIIINCKTLIENHLPFKIKCPQTDGGTEFVNTELSAFLQKNGIMQQISCPYTPEQNGIAERKNRPIL